MVPIYAYDINGKRTQLIAQVPSYLNPELLQEISRLTNGKAYMARGPAIETVFATVDDDGLLAASLAKRLRGRDIADDRERERLYRYLVGQGFEHDRVMKALRSHNGRKDR